jgi:hypothetical protein
MEPYALEAWYTQCCLVIKFYTYHVDNYKDFFIFYYKEGYVFQKIIQFPIVVGYTFSYTNFKTWQICIKDMQIKISILLLNKKNLQ